MRRGEVWWATLDDESPIVLLSGEVPLGSAEGRERAGVVRAALPQQDRIFCTWHLNVDWDALVERVGTLSATKMGQLEIAVRLSGIE